ncbi:MAG: Ig-like domain-containing protein [Pirellulaceae bacterium]
MQQEFDADYPNLGVQFLGVNQAGLEQWNDFITDGKDLPWLQDVDGNDDGDSDVWTSWGLGHLDLAIVDRNNELAAGFSLIQYSLGEGENYNALRQLILGVATVPPPSGLDLLADSDSGADAGDNVTRFDNRSLDTALNVQVEGVTQGAIVRLWAGNQPIGQAVASGTNVVITTDGASALGEGANALSATQEVDGLLSEASTSLNLVIDTTIGAFVSTPPVSATANVAFSYDVQHADEGEADLSYTAEDPPAGLAIDPQSGIIQWTPGEEQAGAQSFAVVATDRAGNTRTQNVNVLVSVNQTLAVQDDSFVVDEDSSNVPLDVLANDAYDGDGAASLRIVSVSEPEQGGTVEITGGGSAILYTPAGDFFGKESFTYEVLAGTEAAQATVTVDVNAINDAPDARDDAREVTKDGGPFTLEVLTNDSILPDAGESLTIVEVTQGSRGGSVSIGSDGRSLEYTPVLGFTGEEIVTYTVRDDGGASDQAVVTVTVQDDVPSRLAGVVYFDNNNNGIQDAGERPIGHVTLSLSGSDLRGESVQRVTRTAADGSYRFEGLAPGNYEIAETQPVHLIDGRDAAGSQGGSAEVNDRISIVLGEGIDGTGNNFGERGFVTEMINISFFFASTPQTVAYAAATPDGCYWFMATEDWEGVNSANFELPPDGETVALTLTDAQQRELQTQFDTTSSRQARVVGQRHGAALVQVAGQPADFLAQATPVFVPVQAGRDEIEGEGEGESASEAEFLPPRVWTETVSPQVPPFSVPKEISGRVTSEMESYTQAADAVLGDDLWTAWP